MLTSLCKRFRRSELSHLLNLSLRSPISLIPISIFSSAYRRHPFQEFAATRLRSKHLTTWKKRIHTVHKLLLAIITSTSWNYVWANSPSERATSCVFANVRVASEASSAKSFGTGRKIISIVHFRLYLFCSFPRFERENKQNNYKYNLLLSSYLIIQWSNLRESSQNLTYVQSMIIRCFLTQHSKRSENKTYTHAILWPNEFSFLFMYRAKTARKRWTTSRGKPCNKRQVCFASEQRSKLLSRTKKMTFLLFQKKYGCKHITPSESKRLSLGSFLRYTFLDAKAIAIDFSIISKHISSINRFDEQCSLKKTKRSRSK